MSSRYSDLALFTRRPWSVIAPHAAPTRPAHVVGLRFALPHAVAGSVVVLDAEDHVVRTLLSRTLPAGELHVDWDGCGDDGCRVPRGVYRLRLDLEGRTVTTRLLEIR